MWLLRGLQFTCVALQNAQANASEELADAFKKSYDGTLKAFHNFVVKGIFSVGSLSCSGSPAGVHFFCSGRDESMPLSHGFLREIEG